MSDLQARVRNLEAEVETLREVVDVYEETVSRQSERMESLLQDLRRSNADLDQFAYAASHDLRTPVRSLSALVGFLEEDLADRLTPESREHIHKMKVRIGRLDSLIQGILEYSRVTRVRPRPEEVDVLELVRQVTDLLDPAPGMQVLVDGPLPRFVTERPRLQQVLQNLIGNALKYHDKPAGTVHISCDETGARYRFTVQDDGPGIAPEYHERVFGMFQRLEVRDKVDGTGIGLALVRRIVEDQGGQVTLESQPGKGATFRFTWPREPPVREVPVGAPTPLRSAAAP